MRCDGVHRARHQSLQGFTLIEVMIAVAIVSITVGLALPSFTQMMARYELRKATASLAERVTMARLLAMNRNVPIGITPVMAGRDIQAQILNLSVPPPPQPILNGELIQTTGVSAIFNPTGGAPNPPGAPAPALPAGILINSQGLLVGAPPAVVVWSLQNPQGDVYSVSISPGGRVRWCQQMVVPPAVCP